MSLLPLWAKKPKHKKAVVATSRGWEVASTGELLKSVKNLDAKLSVFLKEVKEIEEPEVEGIDLVDDPIISSKETETSVESDEKPKKRGRRTKAEIEADKVKKDLD